MRTGTRFPRVRTGNAAVAMAAAAFACVGPLTPSQPKSPSTVTKVVDAAVGGGRFAVGQSCNASGVETCFNATDDNCNGLVDEGCGLATGVLQIVAAWDEPTADVDLEVIDPSGEPAEVGRVTAAGLTKDRDCPGETEECGGQNFEVVTNVSETLPLGRYRVTLILERPAQGVSVVGVRIGGHVGQDALSGHVELSTDRPQASVELLHSSVRTQGIAP